jgi:hypothetical protein
VVFAFPVVGKLARHVRSVFERQGARPVSAKCNCDSHDSAGDSKDATQCTAAGAAGSAGSGGPASFDEVD